MLSKLIKIGDLVFHFLKLFTNFDLHVSELQLGAWCKKAIFKNLVEMSSSDNLWGVFDIE